MLRKKVFISLYTLLSITAYWFTISLQLLVLLKCFKEFYFISDLIGFVDKISLCRSTSISVIFSEWILLVNINKYLKGRNCLFHCNNDDDVSLVKSILPLLPLGGHKLQVRVELLFNIQKWDIVSYLMD